MFVIQTTRIAPQPRTIGRFRSNPAPVVLHVVSENHSAWIRVPTMRPLIASTLDQANQ